MGDSASVVLRVPVSDGPVRITISPPMPSKPLATVSAMPTPIQSSAASPVMFEKTSTATEVTASRVARSCGAATSGVVVGTVRPHKTSATATRVITNNLFTYRASVMGVFPRGQAWSTPPMGGGSSIRDFRFACPRWPLYTPEGRPAPETLVRHSIVPLQRPSAQPVVTCGRLEALFSRHFSDTAPHVGHFFANRTALPVPRVSLPAPAAPRSAATCRRTAAGLDVLPPAGASSTWHASRAGPRSSPAAAGDS